VTEHDVLIALCLNGNSPPVVRALRKATEQGAFTVGISGGEGGEMLDATRLCLLIPATQRHLVEECQQVAVHVLCQLVEQALCDDTDNAEPVLI